MQLKDDHLKGMFKKHFLIKMSVVLHMHLSDYMRLTHVSKSKKGTISQLKEQCKAIHLQSCKSSVQSARLLIKNLVQQNILILQEELVEIKLIRRDSDVLHNHIQFQIFHMC